MKKKKLGLIGFPLGHSFSKSYFADKFENEDIGGFEYLNFEMETVNGLRDLIEKETELIGLNVTIPHKENVIPILDELDPVAEAIGAVNTIKIYRTSEDIKLKGFNTDAHGFKQSMLPYFASQHQKALILGTGGAAKAVEYVLDDLGVDLLYVSRNPQTDKEVGYDELNKEALGKFKFIINSTPLGMHPNVDRCPDIPYELLTPEHFLFDLVYNPAETLFLKKGKEKNAIILNGLNMLKMQAEKAWDIWTTDSI